MARARWTTPALQNLRAVVEWWSENTGPRLAAQVATDIAQAGRRAARNPEGYVWVGAVHSTLEHAPQNVRRVLTQSRRHIVYYRYRARAGEADILAVRGASQLLPTAGELLA